MRQGTHRGWAGNAQGTVLHCQIPPNPAQQTIQKVMLCESRRYHNGVKTTCQDSTSNRSPTSYSFCRNCSSAVLEMLSPPLHSLSKWQMTRSCVGQGRQGSVGLVSNTILSKTIILRMSPFELPAHQCVAASCRGPLALLLSCLSVQLADRVRS